MTGEAITDCGIINFRELGGYQAQDEKSVRSGILYRGAAPAELSDGEKEKFTDLQIQTIFDLRSSVEVEGKPDFVPEGSEYVNYSGIVDMPDDYDMGNDGNLDILSLSMALAANPEGIENLGGYMINSYRQMAWKPEAFRELFRVLLEKPGQSILYHCAAGKDRTGVASAFILRILGVSMDTVMEDYLLSNIHHRQENEVILKKIREVAHNERSVEIIEGLLTVQEMFLQTTFEEIDRTYGSFDGFVQQGLGLSEEDVDLLKDSLLD